MNLNLSTMSRNKISFSVGNSITFVAKGACVPGTVKKIKHRSTRTTFQRNSIVIKCPCFVLEHSDFIIQFGFKIPGEMISWSSSNVFLVQDYNLSKLDDGNNITNILMDFKHHNMLSGVVATMGVYNNSNLRGKQWVCSLTVMGVVAQETFNTYQEAKDRLFELKEMIKEGTFIHEFKRDKIEHMAMGHCFVDEGEEGERCDGVTTCKEYNDCLKKAFKYDLKGWRVNDTHKPSNI